MAPTKILIVTDSAALPSGMAETTRLIFEGLLDHYPGVYEIHQLGLFHCYAVTHPRWPVYPTISTPGPIAEANFVQEDRYGQQSFSRWQALVQPDIVFGFGEPHRVAHLCSPKETRPHGLVLYINIDGLPVSPDYTAPLRNADHLITMSEFSLDILLESMPQMSPNRVAFLYSPADTQRFCPAPRDRQLELRRDLLPAFIPEDAFILGWVGRNQWRKQVWVLYKVIHYLRCGDYLVCQHCEHVTLFDYYPGRRTQRRSDSPKHELRAAHAFGNCRHCGRGPVQKADPMTDVFLWLHLAKELQDEWDPRILELQFDVRRDRDLFYTEGHTLKSALSPSDMPVLYQLWDCLLYLSGGEGFGIPAWEAMCTALPIVYTNYSAHAEFIGRGNGGLPVGGSFQPESHTCIWRLIANAEEAVEAVRKLYFHRARTKELGSNGRVFAEQYNVKTQASKWHQIFQQALHEHKSLRRPQQNC